MHLSAVSDRPLKPYEEHALRVLESLDDVKSDVESFALVALLKDGTAAVSYFRMEVTDLMRAASELQLEAIDTAILNNIGRYADAADDYRETEMLEEDEDAEESSGADG